MRDASKRMRDFTVFENPELGRMVMLLREGKPIWEIIRFLLLFARKGEKIYIFQWVDQFYYVEIRDPANRNAELGFTCDIRNGTIKWVAKGGNCWCRSQRWKNLLVRHFPFVQHMPDLLHWYGGVKPPKSKKET